MTTERCCRNAELRDLHRRYAVCRHPEVRDRLLDAYSGLARSLALASARPTDDLEDLLQVAMLGMVQALERFDPARGFEFSTFAWATVEGELKRHHRDQGWVVHVPRRIQEAYLRTSAAIDELSQELGHQPSVAEVAERTGDDEETVIRALEARQARRPGSLDVRAGETGEVGWEPKADDRSLEAVDDRGMVESLLVRLPDQEREIVEMRFYLQLTQAEIAIRIGSSQMHVSRSITRALQRLRELHEAEPKSA